MFEKFLNNCYKPETPTYAELSVYSVYTHTYGQTYRYTYVYARIVNINIDICEQLKQ